MQFRKGDEVVVTDKESAMRGVTGTITYASDLDDGDVFVRLPTGEIACMPDSILTKAGQQAKAGA